MSKKKQTKVHGSDVQEFTRNGVEYVVTADEVTATTRGGVEVVLSLVLDLDELFQVIEGVQAISDDADVFQTMQAVRQLMTDDFRAAVKGVDAVESLGIFMAWTQQLGERLGKALS